jgi:hypothetical protein
LTQGCQMAYFYTKNGNFGKALKWKIFDILYSNLIYTWQFRIFCGNLVYFVVVWYIVSSFGNLLHEKSGNTGLTAKRSYVDRGPIQCDETWFGKKGQNVSKFAQYWRLLWINFCLE